MRKNTETVLNAWHYNRAAGKSGGSIWTDGERIFSYQTCLVERDGGTTYFNDTRYSPTTTQHQNAIAAGFEGWRTQTVRNVPRDTKHLAPCTVDV